MKFKEGQLIIRINHPETECRKVEKGGITCPDCLKRIKIIKDINLNENMQ